VLCCRPSVVLSKRHVVFPRLTPNAILSHAPAKPNASLGPCLAVSKPKRHVALRLFAFRREPKCHVSQCGFFHSNSSFLKFINDDNNIYNINNNIFSSSNVNYYKNNILYNTKYNNILETNTIN
jgi:hypothetical protein